MGRTAPSVRVALDKEIIRIRKILRYLKDPEDRRILEELLSCSYKIIDAYRYEPYFMDPIEPIILGMILCLHQKTFLSKGNGACRSSSS